MGGLISVSRYHNTGSSVTPGLPGSCAFPSFLVLPPLVWTGHATSPSDLPCVVGHGAGRGDRTGRRRRGQTPRLTPRGDLPASVGRDLIPPSEQGGTGAVSEGQKVIDRMPFALKIRIRGARGSRTSTSPRANSFPVRPALGACLGNPQIFVSGPITLSQPCSAPLLAPDLAPYGNPETTRTPQ